jgi:DNA-directed RNA polymerase I, II, and III subunit RPABC2
MSDNESYSDDNSEVESSDDESNIKSVINLKSLTKKSLNKKSEQHDGIDDADLDESDEDDDSDDDDSVEQTGGVGDETDDDDAESVDEDDDDDDDNIELDEEGEPIIKESVKKTNKVVKPKTAQLMVDDDEEEDEYDDNYLQKFDNDLIKNYVNEFHPECLNHNYDEIAKLSIVVRNSDNIIVDPLHRTIPYLTKYERARILGQRAKQIESGSRPLVKIPENIVDSYIIAELELREKKIPFIIRRPIPGGACEYWSLRDLEIISF